MFISSPVFWLLVVLGMLGILLLGLSNILYWRRTGAHILATASLSILLASCISARQRSSNTASQLETANPDEPTREHVDLGFYELLKCSQLRDGITSTNSGMSWKGLTIGVSSLAEVRETISSEGIEQQSASDYLRFTHRDPPGESPWLQIQACFADNILIVMQIDGGADFNTSLDEWVSKYGEPDRITWGKDYYSRSAIWADDGILALVSYIGPDAWGVAEVILFPPIARTELEDSWLLVGLPDKLHGQPGDVLPLPGPVEDPWGIEP